MSAQKDLESLIMPYNERERFKQWANEFKDLGFEE
jgi:hypothetical protein